MTRTERFPADERRLLTLDRTCPQCLNPHTVLTDQQYRGRRRFCPMCDYSWSIEQPGKDTPAERKASL
jgi:hypothetical protein